MYRLDISAVRTTYNKERCAREAALLLFCDPLPERCIRLAMLSHREWQRLLHWLDVSGLALYFLDRISELKLHSMLPPTMLVRLQQNLIDNSERMHGMIEESAAIHQAFQAAGIFYATLKGFSLWPSSLLKLELRSQLDLDFLVAEKDMTEARRILENRGYHLHAASGKSWEFKISGWPTASLKNMYKPTPYRCVELHIEDNGPRHTSQLIRTERRTIHGIHMPVFAPVDLLLGQAMHLFKHVSSDFVRAAHLIEFRRHVLARSDEADFWTELEQATAENRRASFALGVVTSLITHLTGDFAPKELTSWTVDTLPSFVRLWVELYGARVIFANFPGNKLHLLLQKELESTGIPTKRSRLRALLPTSLPPAIVKASARESLSERIGRYYGQICFIFFRLRFHTKEGLCYLLETFRWRKYKAALEDSGSLSLHDSLV